MSKYVRMSSSELSKVKAYIQESVSGVCGEEPGSELVAISGICVDAEWAYGQGWYMTAYCDVNDVERDESDDQPMDASKMPVPPRYLVRTMELSNTGMNWLVDVVEGEYHLWGMGEELGDSSLYGSGPAYQGCYDYDDEDNLVSDPEALEWVDELYEDAEGVWV